MLVGVFAHWRGQRFGLHAAELGAGIVIGLFLQPSIGAILAIATAVMAIRAGLSGPSPRIALAGVLVVGIAIGYGAAVALSALTPALLLRCP